MSEFDLKNTYWLKKGKFQALYEKLRTLVPENGKVEDDDNNTALETFRIASNCYYDLYNNGLCNYADEFRNVFGFGPKDEFRVRGSEEKEFDAGDDYYQSLDTAEVRKIERRFTKIILRAAREQKIEVEAAIRKSKTVRIIPR